ncbi:winged helix-turn-helix transcriptional regulator [Quadrisphaera sp. INWT6]|nr:winged helix-turn-helix transcriptional regulator [Quadrisphaera sp. INWT6]
MCADTPMTNAAIAERLGLNAATALHHVRTLVASEFLEPMPSTRGRRGARSVPYRATRKSWVLDERRSARAMVEAFTQTLPVLLGDDDAADRPAGTTPATGAVPDPELQVARLGLRLDDDGRAELQRRLDEVLDEFATRPPTPDGAPVSLFLALHRDPDRD